MVMQSGPTVIEVPTVVQAPAIVRYAPSTPVQTIVQQAVPAPSNPAINTLTPQEIEALRGLLQKSSTNSTVKSRTNTNTNPQAQNKASRVTVVVPAEARLWVDNVECPLTSTVRSFNTPPLSANQQYFYSLKVELARDGRTISETQRVLITPGQEARVDFTTVGSLRTVAR